VLSKELPKIVNANECFSKSDRLKIYTQYLYRMECFTNNYEDMQLAIGVIGDWFDGESDDENRMILDGVLVAVCQRHKVSVLRKEWLLRLARSPSRIDQYYSLHAGSNFFGVAHSNFVGSEIYVVQDGEDCYDVATKWNVTPADLKKMNKLKSADLSKGQVLKIPPPYLPRHIPVGSEQNSGGLVRP
jgi:hypothetical protein